MAEAVSGLQHGQDDGAIAHRGTWSFLGTFDVGALRRASLLKQAGGFDCFERRGTHLKQSSGSDGLAGRHDGLVSLLASGLRRSGLRQGRAVQAMGKAVRYAGLTESESAGLLCPHEDALRHDESLSPYVRSVYRLRAVESRATRSRGAGSPTAETARSGV